MVDQKFDAGNRSRNEWAKSKMISEQTLKKERLKNPPTSGYIE